MQKTETGDIHLDEADLHIVELLYYEAQVEIMLHGRRDIDGSMLGVTLETYLALQDENNELRERIEELKQENAERIRELEEDEARIDALGCNGLAWNGAYGCDGGNSDWKPGEWLYSVCADVRTEIDRSLRRKEATDG